MQKRTMTLVVGLLVILFITTSSALGAGTALMLGSGQEFRLDLPLEPGKSYVISMGLRTDLSNAIVTMTLCHIQNNNEVLETQISELGLSGTGSWQVLSLPEVQTPLGAGRYELVITVNKEGRYFWKDLKVERNFGASLDMQTYWSERLATQGAFFTGLVIDARHLDVRRGMSPRIYSESGQLLYGGVLASHDTVQEHGVVGYGSELTSSLLERLAVDHDYPYIAPLVVEAIGVADAAQTGVYISAEDTRKVLEAMVSYDFFARYAVIFLIK